MDAALAGAVSHVRDTAIGTIDRKASRLRTGRRLEFAMTAQKLATTGPERRRVANRRTAFALLAIAVLFFVGIIATRFVGEAATGISVMGGAVLLFLIIAIGRNLIDKR